MQLGDTSCVPSTFKLGIQPSIHDGGRETGAHNSLAQTKHVCIVVLLGGTG